MDVEPRDLRAGHEVKLGLASRIGVEGPEAEPEEFRSGVVALEDRRTTAPGEEPTHARAGLPALKEVFAIDEDEVACPDSGCGAEARARMLAAAPAVAQGDRADEISADLVAHASARA